MLKKEITKSQVDTGEKSGEYRQMLVQAVHTCAIKFPETAGPDRCCLCHAFQPSFLGERGERTEQRGGEERGEIRDHVKREDGERTLERGEDRGLNGNH
jgi:hypothetical protein